MTRTARRYPRRATSREAPAACARPSRRRILWIALGLGAVVSLGWWQIAPTAAERGHAAPASQPTLAPRATLVNRRGLVRAPVVLTAADTPAPAARSAFDFTGPEFEAPSARRLSAAVPADELSEIEQAWHSGAFAAAAAIAARWTEHGDRRQLLCPLVADWARGAPVDAGAFVWGLPAGVERRELLEVVMETWTARDLVAASNWLNTLPADPDLDRAVAVVATSPVLRDHQPETALSWAESIETRPLRRDAISTVLLDWAARNPAAAQRFLDRSAALDADERAQVLTLLRQQLARVP